MPPPEVQADPKLSTFEKQHVIGKYITEGDQILKDIVSGEISVYQHQVDAVRACTKSLVGSATTDVALVVLPTGSGKSGVIALVPYAMLANRVLVITPSVVISQQLRDTMAGNFDILCYT